MGRIITLLMAVLMTPVVIVFLSPGAKAQHVLSDSECQVKAQEAGWPGKYLEFQGSCISLHRLYVIARTPEPLPPQHQPQQRQQQQQPPNIQKPWAWADEPTLGAQRQTENEKRYSSNPQSSASAARNETDYEKMVRLYGKDTVERAHLRYPWASQDNERNEAMADELRAAADRQQGNSYSIRVR